MANIISGGTPKTEISEYWNGDIPWLSVKDFSGNTRHVYSSEKSITELGLNNSATQLLFPGDIIISARGTVGEIAQVGKTMAFNQSCYGLRAKDGYLADFLYYVLKYQIKHLKAVANGAVFDTIILKTFDKMKCNVPPFSVQTRIADILSSYDDLIENNNRRIQLLEQTAQELYKEWFVRFRFPGHEKVKFENGLPEGWEIKRIGDVVEVGRGSSPRPINNQIYFKNGTIPWIKIADATSSRMFIFRTKEHVNDYGASFSRQLEPGSLILAASGTLGFPMFLAVKGCIHDGWLYFTNFKNIPSEYLYYVLYSSRVYFNNLSYGAAIQNINTDIVRKSKIIIPNMNILNSFVNIVSSIHKQIEILAKQNENFIAQRDLLLPRLMSGKMEVSE